MALPPFLSSIIGWLRAGYPEGVPDVDYIPLFALLGSQLTESDVHAIAEELENESKPESAEAIRKPSPRSPTTAAATPTWPGSGPAWPRAAGPWPSPSESRPSRVPLAEEVPRVAVLAGPWHRCCRLAWPSVRVPPAGRIFPDATDTYWSSTARCEEW